MMVDNGMLVSDEILSHDELNRKTMQPNKYLPK